MPDIPCFFVDPAPRARLYLRRYRSTFKETCSGPMGYHDAMNYTGDVPLTLSENGWEKMEDHPKPPKDDPRWPTHCSCGYAFIDEDQWQIFHERVYVRRDNGQEVTLRDHTPGMMWYSDWRLPEDCGPDGHSLTVQTPGGEWCIDDRASNCTLPDDKEHKCWVRHGEVPNITVDKSGGPTCAAGAGSIQAGSYHGFLRNGHLVD